MLFAFVSLMEEEDEDLLKKREKEDSFLVQFIESPKKNK